MLVQRQENNEILIKLSSDLNSFDFQRLIEYVRFLEISSKSKAKQKDINDLAISVSANWWKKNKKRFIK
jgi:hypothetical protein